jgi:multicomponent K+:H+ antiporter subunit A
MFFAETVFVTGDSAPEYLLPAAATLAGVFAVVYSLRFGHDVFFGHEPRDLPREPHEPVPWMRVPIEVLVLLCVVVGMLPAVSVGPLLATAARPVVGGTLPEYSLAVWHGWTPALLMSVVAMVGGLLLYLLFAERFKARRGRALWPGLDGRSLFDAGFVHATRSARGLLGLLSTRRLQPQLLAVVVIAGLAGLSSALVVPLTWGDRPRVPVTPEFAALWAIAGACAIGAAWQAKFHRLAALTMLSIVGVAVCITFAWFSAPDLALTQLAVEVVTLVLCLLGLRWLPKRVPGDDDPLTARRAWWRRRRDLVLAAFAGSGLSVLSYALLTREAPLSISPFFLARALPEGGGTNVVNVMLVDFRAFDTLGEITVLGIVGLTVYALLRRFRPPREALERPEQQFAHGDEAGLDLVSTRDDPDRLEGYLEIPAVLVRLLLPVAFAFAAYLFLRGHNEPGGGFVAGLVVAIAYIAQYMAGGTRWVEQRLHMRPHRWIATGLGLALATGLGSLAFGFPFLTTHTAHVTWPLVGEVHLPTAAVFDLGVFAVVVGSTLLVLTAIAHQSLRARRRQVAGAEMRTEDGWSS